jgi:hypothetical protein
MAALCQALLRLRDASRAALVVVHISRVVQYLPLAHADWQVTAPIQALRGSLAR